MSAPNLVLPIDYVGPGPDSLGAVPTFAIQPGEFTKIPGDKAEPAPMIPPQIKWSKALKDRFINYISNELWTCESERQPFVRKIARLREKYRAPFPETPKDWPLANSSQITIPIIKTSVNVAQSRLSETILAAEPLVTFKTELEDMNAAVFDFEEFIQIYNSDYVGVEEIIDNWISEIALVGTGVIEVSNKVDQIQEVQYDPTTGEYVKRVSSGYSGPCWYNFPIEDFWCRPVYQNPQTAPWCGKVLRVTWSELKDMAMRGMIDPEELKGLWQQYDGAQVQSEVTVADQKIERHEPHDFQQFQIHELAVRWDCDGDGVDEEIFIRFHLESRTLLRSWYSGFRRNRRPWIVRQLVKIPHRLYGEGLGDQLEHLQEEISTMHNQRIDNATIVNLRIILVSRIIQGLRPGDRLWSGKIVKVNDIAKDVGTLQLGDAYPSTVINENISLGYARELSGISETATGAAQPVSRTTAAAQLALIEELNRRFAKTIRNLRSGIREAHTQERDLFAQQQGTGGLAEEWLGTVRGRRVDGLLQLPTETLDRVMKIRSTATKSSNNREVEFQTQIAILQLIIQNAGQLLSMAQQLAPDIIPVLAHEIIATIRPVFRKVMQYADAGDPDQAVAALTVLERVLPAPENLGGMDQAQANYRADVAAGNVRRDGANGARTPGAPSAEEQSPMAGLADLLREANGRRGPVVARGGRR